MERPRERRHTYAAPTLPGGRLTVDEVRCTLGDPSTTPPRGLSRCGCVGGAHLVCCRWCSVGTALLQLTAAGTCTALLFMRTSGAASAASDTAAAADDDDDERRRRRRHKHTHTTCMAWRFRCVTPNHRFDDGGGGFDADRLAHEDALECGIISVQ